MASSSALRPSWEKSLDTLSDKELRAIEQGIQNAKDERHCLTLTPDEVEQLTAEIRRRWASSLRSSPAVHVGPGEQYAMPLRPPTGVGLPNYIVIRPFWVKCQCTSCSAYTLVDGAGEFECPTGCGCKVVVK